MTTRNTGIRSILADLDTLTVGQNVRLPTLYQTEAMRDDIMQDGLTTPIMVWQPKGKDGPFEVIRGLRRFKGLKAFRSLDPQGFEARFAKGIPLELRVGIDAKEALKLKVDHGNVVTLSDPHEVQMAASMLFDAGATELEVAVALRGLFEAIKPMRGKNLLKVQALEAKLPLATALEVEEIRRSINKIVKDYHRGRVQIRKTVWRCPEIVMQARFFRACGVRPEGVSATTYLPTVTTDQAKRLEKAFAKDLILVDDRTGVSRYSKRLPGPNFTTAWEALCKADQEETPDVPKKKALSGKIIRESSGGYNSVGFRAMCGLHCGDTPEVGAAVKEADELLYTAELVAKHDASLWEAVVEARKVIEGRIIAEARAEAEAKAAAEGVTLDQETGEVVSETSEG